MHFEIRGKCIWNEKCILIPEEMHFEFRRNGSDPQSTAVQMCEKRHRLTSAKCTLLLGVGTECWVLTKLFTKNLVIELPDFAILLSSCVTKNQD